MYDDRYRSVYERGYQDGMRDALKSTPPKIDESRRVFVNYGPTPAPGEPQIPQSFPGCTGPRYLSIAIAAILILFASSLYAQTARLMSRVDDERFRGLIPATDDDEINEIAADPRTIIYTRKEMPPQYWHDGGFVWGFYDLGPDEAPHPQNACEEFPWADGGGFHDTEGTETFKFLHLPEGKRIAYGYAPHFDWRAGAYTYKALRWIYPTGTVFGEVAVTRDPRGFYWPVELRIRRKEIDEWGVDVFRPFPTSDDLLSEIPEDNPVAQHIRRGPLRQYRLIDGNHGRHHAFDVTTWVDSLPSFDDDALVRRLLDREFQSCLGETWRGDCVCATTAARFSIVETNNNNAFLGNDRESCKKCHQDTQIDVAKFQQFRDWYGSVPGSDQSLSFHITDPAAATTNGFTWPIKLRGSLRDIIAPLNAVDRRDYYDTSPAR